MFEQVIRALEAPLVVRDPFRPLDAIVVLGAPLGPDGRATPPLAERAHAAAALFHAGGAPLVVASGGITHGAPRAEADAIADELRDHGVPGDRISIERASLTTAENARRTAALLAREGRSDPLRVWIVTQPFHGRRAKRLFRGAGFVAHVWHIESSLEYRDRRRALRWVVREYAAWAALLARGG